MLPSINGQRKKNHNNKNFNKITKDSRLSRLLLVYFFLCTMMDFLDYKGKQEILLG